MEDLSWLNTMRGAIFDLDGVLVDTAKYHYLAWKRLAQTLGFDFTERQNERLKGVRRMRSLEILLEEGGVAVPDSEKERLATIKNDWYVELISRIDENALLPGAREYLAALRARGVKLALGSASKNAGIILRNTGIAPYFDAIVDGTKFTRAKPDPQVFLLAARELGLAPAHCVVFEDAQAGVDAALAGGMRCVAIGSRETLRGANGYAASLGEVARACHGALP